MNATAVCRLGSSYRLAAFVLLVFALLSFAAVAQNPAGGFDPEPTGSVSPMAIQPDGKILVGGTFAQIDSTTRGYLARINPDGSLDAAFADPAAGPIGLYVLTLALQTDGRILVGGQFSQIAGNTRNFIARLNSNGTFDATFTDPALNGYVTGVIVQPDGKVLITGFFTQLGSSAQFNLARLNADGTRDETFTAPVLNSGGGGGGYVIALQPDGKILVAAPFSTIGGQTRHGLARLNANGTVDPTFGDTNACCIGRIVLQPDGKILVGGGFAQIDGQTRNRVARLNADGTLDAAFLDTGITLSFVDALILQPDGKVLIGGGFTQVGANTRKRVARLNSDGTFDATFADPGLDNDVYGLALQSDGKVLVGGLFAMAGAVTRKNLARFYPDGSLDAKLIDPGAVYVVETIALQADGKILVGGQFSQFAGRGSDNFTRLNSDGSPDLTFNGPSMDTTNSYVVAIAAQFDGKILIGGDFTQVGGQTHNYVARLNANGTLDATFDDPALTGAIGSGVGTIALQADGKILLTGSFTKAAGQTHNGIVRLYADGTIDGTFNDPQISGGFPGGIALQPDGKILIGGNFAQVGGHAHNFVARLNGDGTLDPMFTDPGLIAVQNLGGNVGGIALQPDGKILVGGSFEDAQGSQQVTRLNADGTRDPAFSVLVIDDAVGGIFLQPDGDFLATGLFTQVGPYGGIEVRHKIARFYSDGTVDGSFQDVGSDIGPIQTLALQPDGKILIGGLFTQIAGHTYNCFARLTTSGAAVQSLGVQADTVAWQRSGLGPELAPPPEVFVASGAGAYQHVGTMQHVSGGWNYPGFNPPFGLYSVQVRASVAYGGGPRGVVQTTAQFYENDRIFADGFQ